MMRRKTNDHVNTIHIDIYAEYCPLMAPSIRQLMDLYESNIQNYLAQETILGENVHHNQLNLVAPPS